MRTLIFVFTVLSLTILSPLAIADMGATTFSYDQTPPAFGSAVNVGAGTQTREVFGSLLIQPSAVSAANVTVVSCATTPAKVLLNFNVPPISGNTITLAYSFIIGGGGCYKFLNNLDPGTANKISSYNFVDTNNEAFESATHANATWCPYSCVTTAEDYANATFCYRGTSTDTGCVGNRYANATFEGQPHANATWCPYSCVTTAEDYANLTFDTKSHQTDYEAFANASFCLLTFCEGQAHANATWEGQAHANATWCPLTCGGGGTNFTYLNVTHLRVDDANISLLYATQFFLSNGSIDNLFLGNVSASGNVSVASVEVTTNADPYIPVLVWGGLFVLFLYFRAWLPAMMALLSLAAQMPVTIGHDAWINIPGCVMLVAIGLFIHVLAVAGVMPGPWGRYANSTRPKKE